MFFRSDAASNSETETAERGESTRLLIADASAALRMGMRMIFSLDPAIEVVAEASTADEFEYLAYQTQPHIVVFDADMQGIERSLSYVVRTLPGAKLVALTMQTSPQFHAFVLAMGAIACIEKRASPMELLEAVQDARAALTER